MCFKMRERTGKVDCDTHGAPRTYLLTCCTHNSPITARTKKTYTEVHVAVAIPNH